MTRGQTPDLVRRMQRDFGNRYTTDVLRAALAPPAADVVPRAAEARILAARGGGQPLEASLRRDMEARFDHDFSSVRVHTDNTAVDASRATQASAFALGPDLFFDRGEYRPGSSSGRELIAHELAHVVQTAGAAIHTPLTISQPHDAVEREADSMVRETDAHQPEMSAPAAVHRKCACGANAPSSEECEQCKASRSQSHGIARKEAEGSTSRPVPTFLPAPEDLAGVYWVEIFTGRFARVADPLYLALKWHPRPYAYIRKAIEGLDSGFRDNVGAEFVSRLTEPDLDRMAESGDGRATMNVLYEEIITGSVSQFEREHANRLLMAKARRKSPEDFLKATKFRPDGKPTRIFPLRFMGILPRDDAPLLAKLQPDGTIRVTYPVRVAGARMFQQEFKTLGNVFTSGEVVNANETVGIKDYESGGETLFLPALALLDYSNRAIQSTTGKIIDVAMIAATMGGSGAVSAAGRWGRALLWADRAANVIQIAAVVVGENRDWIIEKFPHAGPVLVRAVEVANTAAAIYGFGRLGMAGFEIVKDMRAAAKAAREEAAALKLTAEESRTINRLDAEVEALAKEAEAEAAKASRAVEPGEPASAPEAGAPGKPAERPTATNEPAAPAKPAEKPVQAAEKKPAKAADEIHVTATKKKIPTLREEVAELNVKAGNPENVRQPSNRKFDAEIETGAGKDGHTFERERATGKWCRHSNSDDCGLDLGRRLKDRVDRAIDLKQAKRNERISREVAEQFEEAQKFQPVHKESRLRRDDPHWSESVARLEENAAFGKVNEAYLKEALTGKLMKLGPVTEQVRIRPTLNNGKPAGFEFIADFLVAEGEGFVAIEAKLSRTARLTENQELGYQLLARNGGTVTGKHAAAFKKPLEPTPSMLARPALDPKTTARTGDSVQFWFDFMPAPRPRRRRP